MRVLAIGGSGYIGRLILPLLPPEIQLHVYDPVTPEFPVAGFSKGSVTDQPTLDKACQGIDVLLYLAMGKKGDDIHDIPSAYAVNVQGVHHALEAAVKAGIPRLVFTSSLSVYDGHDLLSGEFDSEEVPVKSLSVYGHTKYLGEEVCRFFHRVHKLPCLALRLYHPVAVHYWRELHTPGKPFAHTAAPDLADGIEAALRLDHQGFEIIHLTGDTSGRAYKHEKANRLLGYQPHDWIQG